MATFGRSGGACTRREHGSWEARKKIRLSRDAYLGGDAFLLTVCTAGRQPLLEATAYGWQAVDALAVSAQKTGASLWCGVVMPEHVHLVLSAADGKNPLDTAACFKRLTTIGARQRGFVGAFWQRRVHDRGLRTTFNNDLNAAVGYVLENPVRRELAASWDEWPLLYLYEGLFGDP